jgi:hypothetical protein
MIENTWDQSMGIVKMAMLGVFSALSLNVTQKCNFQSDI